MASTKSTNAHPKSLPNKSRRTTSLSSISSSESISDSTFSSPTSHLIFSGIPFSWEKIPGIPKQQDPKKKDPSFSLLPLPPIPSRKFNRKETSPNSKKFYNIDQSFRKDPFFAALVECSKDDDQDSSGSVGSYWKGPRATRTLSDRLGFMSLYTSCKTTNAVAESIVYLPRANRSIYES